ncbi:NitT/TauT family transport system substrate-binding protein [Nocardia transvalensis]|uniref:NitT/TauT family transport system substrate-binding protein n=1 Tax=Nocardia transvalensis TaxID=37333 RepID=A0A7W9PHR4_9NOCA|nr:ABC transporter substrate-binding protein [Nocardia transvalensis]MBB5916150.1 NitT/TauT family transport system substrate-binding protein [Nocardia transvalensis]
MMRVLRRRAVAALVAVAAVAVAATACTRPATQAAGNGGDLVRISVGVDPSYAPFFLADGEGLFEAAGLNVRVIQTEGGAAGAQNVVAGTSELSGNADSTALTVMAGNPGLRALGVYEDSDRYFRVVLREGVTPKSVKKMGVFPGIGLYFTDRYLRSLGLDPAAIALVTTSPPEQPALLARGDIDGFISFDPWVARAVAQDGHVAGTTGDFGAKYSQWLLASQGWLSTHEELAGRVFRVVAQAADIIAADPDRAAKAVAKAIRMDPAEARNQVTQIDFKGRDFTPGDIEQARQLVDFFRGQGKLGGPVDPEQVLLSGWVGRNSQ